MQRDKFFTTVTKDAFAISYAMQPLLTVHILEPKFSPIRQVQENIKKSNRIISGLMRGKSQYKEAQNKLNSIINS